MISDLIQVVDCLAPGEVEEVLECLPDEWEPTTIFSGGSGSVVDKSIRSNSRICLQDEEKAAKIMHLRVNEALLEYRDIIGNISPEFNKYPVPGGFNVHCWRERFQVLRYQHEEHYSWHHDTAADRHVNEYHRCVSVVLYLKNAEVGGRTIFPHRAFRPKPGQALIFPSNWCFPHSAEPVEKGEKIVSVTWYQSTYSPT